MKTNAQLDSSAPTLANTMLAEALSSPALSFQSDSYPANYREKVPLKVRMACNVFPDIPFLTGIVGAKSQIVCLENNEYFVWVNSHGAVTAILENDKKLGLKRSEFDIIQWHQ